jgi:hypothetical protein
MAATALTVCVVTGADPAGAQDKAGEPPAGPTAQGRQLPAPAPLPPGPSAVPHGNAPPAAAEPPGTLQSCPDQGRRLELIV